jgi:transposase
MTRFVLRLDRPARRRVHKLDRQTTDPNLRIRCRVLLKVADGLSHHAAARHVGCAPSTAWWIIERFHLQGEPSLLDGRRENGCWKVDDDVREGIRQTLLQQPSDFGFSRPTWTLELLAQVISRQLRVALSPGHLWKVLNYMGVRWGRPRPIVACPWKAARRKRRLARLRRLAAAPPPGEVVVFADEIDIHLNPKIGPDWMLPGYQKLILTPGQNEKRYLAGAYDPQRGRMTYVYATHKASWLFLNLLRALENAYRRAHRIHVILDNFVIHKSCVVRLALLRMPRIRLHFLPPYCPDANRIERQWQDLHGNVTRNHTHRSMQQLMRAVCQYLDTHYVSFRGVSYDL